MGSIFTAPGWDSGERDPLKRCFGHRSEGLGGLRPVPGRWSPEAGTGTAWPHTTPPGPVGAREVKGMRDRQRPA